MKEAVDDSKTDREMNGWITEHNLVHNSVNSIRSILMSRKFSFSPRCNMYGFMSTFPVIWFSMPNFGVWKRNCHRASETGMLMNFMKQGTRSTTCLYSSTFGNILALFRSADFISLESNWCCHIFFRVVYHTFIYTNFTFIINLYAT
jgi:hypothetical protein